MLAAAQHFKLLPFLFIGHLVPLAGALLFVLFVLHRHPSLRSTGQSGDLPECCKQLPGAADEMDTATGTMNPAAGFQVRGVAEKGLRAVGAFERDRLGRMALGVMHDHPHDLSGMPVGAGLTGALGC